MSRHPLVRLLYLLPACAVWVATLGGRCRRGSTIVLCYHGVRDADRASFARQMRAIRGRCVSLSALFEGAPRRGRPRLLVTFDDGFQNLLDNAIPVLRQFSTPGVIFIVTGNMGQTPRWSMPEDHPERGEPILSDAEVRGLRDEPLLSWGSHTVSHPRLSTCSRSQVIHEISASQRQVEGLVGRPVTTMAFPYGDYDSDVVDALEDTTIEFAFTLDHDMVSRGHKLVGRFSIQPYVSRLEFRLLVDGAYAWLGAVRRVSRRISRRSPSVWANSEVPA